MSGRYFKIFLPIIAGLVLLGFAAFSLASRVTADGQGSNATCSNTDVTVDPNDNGSTPFEFEFEAPDGNVVVGVCIKSGANMFGGNQHSGFITTDGTIENGCYTIDGIDADELEVIRNNTGSNCQAISHLDIEYEPEGSSSPSPSPSPCPSPEVDPEWWDDDDDWDWDWNHKPSPSPCPSPPPSPEPSPSPSPSPTPPPVGGGPSLGGNVTTPQCPSDRPQQVDQVWFSDIKPGEVTVHWANKGDAAGFHIAYGPSQNNLIWGVETNDGKASQFTLQNLPGGDLWVAITAKSSAECGGPTSPVVKVGAVGPQVLGATGIAQNAMAASAGLGLIAFGLWQAQSALAKREKRA